MHANKQLEQKKTEWERFGGIQYGLPEKFEEQEGVVELEAVRDWAKIASAITKVAWWRVWVTLPDPNANKVSGN